MLDEPRESLDVSANNYSLDSKEEGLDEQEQDKLYGKHKGGNRE